MEKIESTVGEGYFETFHMIYQKWSDKIIYYYSKFFLDPENENKTNVLAPLKLSVAETIECRSLYFYLQWTNKCESLFFDKIPNWDVEWCNYIIDNCDCSNVEWIGLFYVNFNLDSIKNESSKKLLLKKLGAKFINLTFFYIFGKNLNSYLFYQQLKPILDKNNTYVQLNVDSSYTPSDLCDLILEITKPKAGLKYHELRFEMWNDWIVEFESLVQLIHHQYLESLRFENKYHDDSKQDFGSIVKKLEITDKEFNSKENLKFKSLMKIDIEDYSGPSTKMDTIGDFLNLNIIRIRNVFIVAEHRVDYTKDKNNFSKKFKLLSRRLYTLCIEQQVPIDVRVKFTNVSEESKSDFVKEATDCYSPFFDNERISKEYKEPKCNKYCEPLKCLEVSLTFDEDFVSSIKMPVFHVKNADDIDIWS